jgi:hypothetical protein
MGWGLIARIVFIGGAIALVVGTVWAGYTYVTELQALAISASGAAAVAQDDLLESLDAIAKRDAAMERANAQALEATVARDEWIARWRLERARPPRIVETIMPSDDDLTEAITGETCSEVAIAYHLAIVTRQQEVLDAMQ